MKHLTKEILIKAIQESLGNKGHMLELLGISQYKTLNGYLDRWNLQGLVDEQVMKINDKCENNIFRGINEGDQKYTLWYAERRMFDKYGSKQTVVNETKYDFSNASDSELDEEIKKYE
jgi:hypothetical protein